MSILRELAGIYLIQKRNPFHDELGRFSSGNNAVTTSRGEKFKTARSNFAQKRKEVKNAPDRVQRLRDAMEAKKPKVNQLEKEIDDDLNLRPKKGYKKDELIELSDPLKESIKNLKSSLDYQQKYSKSFYAETAKLWEKEGKQRIYIPRNAFEQAGYITLDENDAKGRLANKIEGTPFYQVPTRGGNMSSLDDAGKLLWEEMKPKIKAKKLKQKEENTQKSELAMQVIRKYQGY